MPGPKSPLVIRLTGSEELYLKKLTRSTTVPAGPARRARIVLLLGRGHSVSETARLVGDQRKIVRKWGRRFEKHRLEGLSDKPRPGRKPVFSAGSGDGTGPDRLTDPPWPGAVA